MITVGNSMIKHLNGRDISLLHTVKVRPNLDASTHDLMEIDSEKETEIICSGLIQREDHDFRDQIEKISCTALLRLRLC